MPFWGIMFLSLCSEVKDFKKKGTSHVQKVNGIRKRTRLKQNYSGLRTYKKQIVALA